MRTLIVVVAAVVLAACGGDSGGGGGGGPAVGGVYAYFDATGDICGADFTQAGVPSPFFAGVRYALKVGSARLFWESNYQGGGCVLFFLDVTIDGGLPGQDRVYDVLLSQNVLFYDERLVPIGTASVGLEPQAGAVPLYAP